jgi:lysophospholipase L1-like esterase
VRKPKVVAIIYIVLLLLTFRHLVHGDVNIVDTLTLYATLLLPLLVLSPTRTIENLRLVLFSIVITLFSADLILLHVIRPESYLTYPERNGEHQYYTLTLRQKFERIRPYFHSKYKMRWPFTNKPNVTKQRGESEFNYPHTYNSEGLRNVEIPVAKKKNEIRLVAFGDSFTEGVGAPVDSTWSSLLNGLLSSNAESRDGDSAEGYTDTVYTVMNAGISGSDPFFEANLLKFRLLKYQPDVVLVAVNMSDVDDVMQRGGFERFKADSTYVIKNSPWWEPIYGASIIFRMVMHNVFHYTHQLMTAEQEKQLRFESQPRLLEAVKEFIELSNENKFKLVVVFHPILNELQQNNFPLSAIIPPIKETENVFVLNLYDEYKNYSAKNNLNMADYYWEKDLHHNSKGYQLWSELVYTKLKEKKIIN